MDIKKMHETLEKSPYCQKLLKEGASASEEIIKKIDAGECSCTETYQCLMCAVRMKFVFSQPDPELEAIVRDATERDVLATAARMERWRVAYEGGDTFAEKPCGGCNGTGSEPDSCPDEIPGCCVTHLRQHRRCGGRGWVRLGVPRQPNPNVITGVADGMAITTTDSSGTRHV